MDLNQGYVLHISSNSGQAGWLSPRLIEEILYNRTINLKGGSGNNIAMDRVNEFHNAQFKGMVKQSNATLSEGGYSGSKNLVFRFSLAFFPHF